MEILRFRNELRFEIYPVKTLRFEKLFVIELRFEIKRSLN